MSISLEEQQRIIALASGSLPPETGMEKHFVIVIDGKVRACSPQEREWVAFWNNHTGISSSTDQKSRPPISAKKSVPKTEIQSGSISTDEKHRIIELASGTLPPETGIEKHFLSILNGKGRACSQKERAWLDYWQNHEAASAYHDQASRPSVPENSLLPGTDKQDLPGEASVAQTIVTDCLSEFDTPPDLIFEDEVVHEEASQLLETLLNKQPSDQSISQQLVHIKELLKTAHTIMPSRIAKQLEAAEELLYPF